MGIILKTTGLGLDTYWMAESVDVGRRNEFCLVVIVLHQLFDPAYLAIL